MIYCEFARFKGTTMAQGGSPVWFLALSAPLATS